MLLATTTPTGAVVLGVAVFLASAVEMVEALTIVLAVGVTAGLAFGPRGCGRRPRSSWPPWSPPSGRPSCTRYPCRPSAWSVGALLLVFGLQWLRKAILRAAGLKAKHDEDAIFAEHVAELSGGPEPASGRDATAFTVAFKGVFLEGLEVVVIVITLGTTSHRLGLAAAAAGAAALVVVRRSASSCTASCRASPRTP